MRIFLVTLFVGAIGAALLFVLPLRSEANHAWAHNEGVGFDGIGPDFGWVNVYRNPQSTSLSVAGAAIDNWRSLNVGSVFWFRDTFNTGEAQAEVIDKNTSTLFGDVHLYVCNTHFISHVGAYATTIVTDAKGDFRGIVNDPSDPPQSGFWQRRQEVVQGVTKGVPFAKASVCLNTAFVNDEGTIAHELGHVLVIPSTATQRSINKASW